MAKTEKAKILERTYNIPLRKEYLKVPKWNRTKKAVLATKQFLKKHLKSEEVRLGPALNRALWQRGIKNPPHHIKVTVIKDEKGLVQAELFGLQITQEKEEKKPSKLEEVAQKVGLKLPEKKIEETAEEKGKTKKVSREKKKEEPKEVQKEE